MYYDLVLSSTMAEIFFANGGEGRAGGTRRGARHLSQMLACVRVREVEMRGEERKEEGETPWRSTRASDICDI